MSITTIFVNNKPFYQVWDNGVLLFSSDSLEKLGYWLVEHARKSKDLGLGL